MSVGPAIATSVTTNLTAGAGTVSQLISLIDQNAYWWTAGQSGGFVKFDMGQNRVITSAVWFQDSVGTHGTWKWQGSTDDVTYTDIGSSFTLGSPAHQSLTSLSGNTTAYRYYKLTQVSGTTSSGPFLIQCQFDGGTYDASGYVTKFGVFNRTSLITVTTTESLNAGSIQNLVQGYAFINYPSTSPQFSLSNSSGNITFDLGSGNSAIFTEATWCQSTADTTGTWKWQGSNDNSTYTDIGSTFTLGGATVQTQTSLSGNTTAYRYYRLTQTGGLTEQRPVLLDIYFSAASTGSVGSSSGVGAATGQAGSIGSSAGTGAATGTNGSIGAAAGTGSASGVGASTAAAPGSAAGVGAATAQSGSTGSASGSGAASGTGEAIAPSVGEADGTGAASATGAPTAAGIGSAAGVGGATSSSGNTGNASGSGAASGAGSATVASAGEADGVGAASAFTVDISAGVGSAAGTGSASAQAGSIGQAAGIGAAAAAASEDFEAVGSAVGEGEAAAFFTTNALGVGNAAGHGFAFTRTRRLIDLKGARGAVVLKGERGTIDIKGAQSPPKLKGGF